MNAQTLRVPPPIAVRRSEYVAPDGEVFTRSSDECVFRVAWSIPETVSYGGRQRSLPFEQGATVVLERETGRVMAVFRAAGDRDRDRVRRQEGLAIWRDGQRAVGERLIRDDGSRLQLVGHGSLLHLTSDGHPMHRRWG